MSGKSGDRIRILGKIKKANPNERAGTIVTVLSENPPRYEIRWDSGRLTVLVPTPGAIRVEAAKKTAAKTTPKAGAKAAAAKPPAAAAKRKSSGRRAG